MFMVTVVLLMLVVASIGVTALLKRSHSAVLDRIHLPPQRHLFRPIVKSKLRPCGGPTKPKIDWVTGRRLQP